MAEGFSLDALCDMFGVARHDRHAAGSDAFLTALIFLGLLRAAKAVGRDTVSGKRPLGAVIGGVGQFASISPLPQTVCRPAPVQRAARKYGTNSPISPSYSASPTNPPIG